ncbi:hypothetical protein [Microbispora bryophytorum]|uniref:hypothetical protein n=1 Tax=Microbispora bryophytorum TaxID=1460882 RepID=UPI0033C063C3
MTTTPEILPPLTEWLRPKSRRYFDQHPDHVAIKHGRFTRRSNAKERRVDEAVYATVPAGQRVWLFGGYWLIPRAYLPALLEALGDHAGEIKIRNTREES